MGQKENKVKDGVLKKYGGGDERLLFKIANVFIRTSEGRGVRGGTVRGFSDLLFIEKRLILPEHVGRYIGQFGLAEAKQPGAHTEKELHQLQENVMQNVIAMGGIAGRVRCNEDFQLILDSWDLRYAS